MNKKYEILPGLFWIGLSISVLIGAYKLGLGGFRDPGAGLMPFLIGGVLFLVSLPMMLRSVFKIRNEISKKTDPGKIDFVKVASVSGALFVYCLLLQKLGYLITTTLLLAFLFKIAGSKKWWFALIGSVLIAIVSYLGFTFLGLSFPRGIVGL